MWRLYVKLTSYVSRDLCKSQASCSRHFCWVVKSCVGIFVLHFLYDIDKTFHERFLFFFLRYLLPAASAFSKETTILGLKRTIFICVVAFAAGVCILGVTVIIFLLVTRRSQRRRAKIYEAKPEKSLNVTEPQGLLFKNAGEKGNGVDETIYDHPDQSKNASTLL